MNFCYILSVSLSFFFEGFMGGRFSGVFPGEPGSSQDLFMVFSGSFQGPGEPGSSQGLLRVQRRDKNRDVSTYK